MLSAGDSLHQWDRNATFRTPVRSAQQRSTPLGLLMVPTGLMYRCRVLDQGSSAVQGHAKSGGHVGLAKHIAIQPNTTRIVEAEYTL